METVDSTPAPRTATIARPLPARLRATEVGGAEVPSLIDEIPVLAVAAAYAEGTHDFADAAELKVKESDRIATMVAALRSLGAAAEPRPDGLVVDGGAGRPLSGGPVDSAGDHRIAMAMAVAARPQPRPGGRIRMGRGGHQLPHASRRTTTGASS